MSIKIATTRVAANTSTGNQDITTAKLAGLIPKAAMLVCTIATSDNTAVDNRAMSIGLTDGTNQNVITGYSENGVGTSDCYRRSATDELIMILDNAGAIDGEANFVSFIAGGIRINWGDAPTAAYLIDVTFCRK